MAMDKMQLVEVLWDYLHLGKKIKKCDCILGLGCHDLHIPERCAELYHQGYADIVIFAGGLGKVTQYLWQVSEAEKFAEIAIKLGVPKDKIYLENKSTNTGDNFRFTKELIEKHNLNINSCLVVHKPYMERRCYAAFKAIMPDKDCFVTSPQINFGDYFKEYETGAVSQDEVINIMVGDLQRMKEYPKKGWQIPQDIPDEVWTSYEQLVKLGYNKYVITEDNIDSQKLKKVKQ